MNLDYNKLKRIKEYVLPTRIVDSKDCLNEQWLLNNNEQQVYKFCKEYFVIKKGGYIILDFNKELHGGIRILTARHGDKSLKQNIHIRFGESVEECCSILGKNNSTNDHSPRDMMVSLSVLSDLEIGQTGFRFVRIDNLSEVDYAFCSILAVYIHLEEKPVGYFKCNDSVWNDIYSTAQHTLFLNMQNRLWDGIKRDRLVWIGDMHPEMMGILALYGEHPLIELGISESALYNNLPCWMCEIPSYSIWWLAILCDYEFYTDKWDFIKSQLDYAYALINQFDKCIDENGAIDYKKANINTAYDYFLNWETFDEQGLEDGNRGLLLWTLRKFIAMSKRRNIDYSIAQKIVAKLEKNNKFNGMSLAVASLFSLGYGFNNDKAKNIIDNANISDYSCFMSDYVSQTLLKAQHNDKAYSFMKDFYQGMLSRGATSFWESFNLNWLKNSGRIDRLNKSGENDIHSSFGKYCYQGYRLSLCHGWSCGPVQFLTRNALGVNFVTSGGKQVKIQPQLMGLKWIEGAVPTKYGLIEVKHVFSESGIKSFVKLPKGVTELK